MASLRGDPKALAKSFQCMENNVEYQEFRPEPTRFKILKLLACVALIITVLLALVLSVAGITWNREARRTIIWKGVMESENTELRFCSKFNGTSIEMHVQSKNRKFDKKTGNYLFELTGTRQFENCSIQLCIDNHCRDYGYNPGLLIAWRMQWPMFSQSMVDLRENSTCTLCDERYPLLLSAEYIPELYRLLLLTKQILKMLAKDMI